MALKKKLAETALKESCARDCPYRENDAVNRDDIWVGAERGDIVPDRGSER